MKPETMINAACVSLLFWGLIYAIVALLLP